MDQSQNYTEALAQAQRLAKLRVAERCKTDLFFLCKYILGYDLMTEFTHGELCAYTQSLLPISPEEKKLIMEKAGKKVSTTKVEETELYDEYDPTKKMLLLMMPRNTFKSSVVTIGFALQFILHEPNGRVLVDSETFSKAKAFLAEIKGHLEDTEKYREVFYTIYGKYPDDDKKSTTTRWTDSQIDVSCRTKKRKEPTFSASGIDKSINGMHYDLIVCDDLHSEKNVTNKEQIEQVIQHWKLSLSLLEPNKYMVVIGTRWHYKDMYQYLLDAERDRFNIMIRQAKSPEGVLFFPEILTEEFLDKQKRSQGSYMFSCTPGETPIWMADGSFKPIADVQIGDIVMGFKTWDGKKQRRLTPTRVISKDSRQAQVQKMTLDSGATVRCTPDHKWFTGRNDTTHPEYKEARVGTRLMRMAYHEEREISLQEQADWSYLAGIIDGEGSCKHGSIQIFQSETHNAPVCRKIEETLKRLNLDFSQKTYNRTSKTPCTCYTIKSNRKVLLDLLRYGKPAKSGQIMDRFIRQGGKPVVSKERIVEIELQGKEIVYALGTETVNYIAWSFGSRNCQYQNDPVDDETATFKRSYFQYKNWEDVRGRPMNWYLAIDPSFDGPYSDYVGMVECAMDYQGELIVGDVYRLKLTYAQIIQLMFDLYQAKKYKTIVIETVATQKSLSYMLNEEQRRRQVWLPVKELASRHNAKEERIRGLAPYYEFRRVWHLRDGKMIEELEDELLHFPVGKHDDVIDALSTVLEIATVPRATVTEDRKEKKTKLINIMNKPRSPLTGV